MKYLFSIATLFVLSSCSYFLLKANGIQNPKKEKIHSINVYANSIGVDSMNLIFAKDTSGLNVLNTQFKGNPEILVFDNNKIFYPYKEDSKACNASIESILANICSIEELKYQTARITNYDYILSNTTDPNQSLKDFNIKNYDFIVFFNFAKYSYGLNNTHIVPWINAIKKNKVNCRVKYIFVNIDYLNTWDVEKKDLPKFKVKL